MPTQHLAEEIRRPLHPGFIGAGAALLIAALLTDLMYYQTALMQWANFSAWLIAGGLVAALIAALVLVLDFATGRAGGLRWTQFIFVAVAAVLSLLNEFVHSRDAWTSVAPQGLGLSLVVTILLLIVAFGGWRVTTAHFSQTEDRQ